MRPYLATAWAVSVPGLGQRVGLLPKGLRAPGSGDWVEVACDGRDPSRHYLLKGSWTSCSVVFVGPLLQGDTFSMDIGDWPAL